MNLNPTQVANISSTLFALVLVYLVKSVFLRVIHSKMRDQMRYYYTKRLVNTISFFTFLTVLAFIWLQMGGTLMTYLGLFSAGIALALKDILLNIAGWLYIILRQPFAVGDRIEVSGIKGDVIDQNLFKFRVIEVGNWVHAEQSTGRIIHIPNSKVFIEPLANYSLGFEYIWDEIRVQVTFESDWKKAKNILIGIIDHYAEDLSAEVQKKIHETSRRFLIYYNNLSPIVYTDVSDSGVVLTMRYICEPKKRRMTTETIWEAVLDAFEKEDDIAIAYPTMRRT
jgi:small-conductance mechanosensitive channel